MEIDGFVDRGNETTTADQPSKETRDHDENVPVVLVQNCFAKSPWRESR